MKNITINDLPDSLSEIYAEVGHSGVKHVETRPSVISWSFEYLSEICSQAAMPTLHGYLVATRVHNFVGYSVYCFTRNSKTLEFIPFAEILFNKYGKFIQLNTCSETSPQLF